MMRSRWCSGSTTAPRPRSSPSARAAPPAPRGRMRTLTFTDPRSTCTPPTGAAGGTVVAEVPAPATGGASSESSSTAPTSPTASPSSSSLLNRSRTHSRSLGAGSPQRSRAAHRWKKCSFHVPPWIGPPASVRGTYRRARAPSASHEGRHHSWSASRSAYRDLHAHAARAASWTSACFTTSYAMSKLSWWPGEELFCGSDGGETRVSGARIGRRGSVAGCRGGGTTIRHARVDSIERRERRTSASAGSTTGVELAFPMVGLSSRRTRGFAARLGVRAAGANGRLLTTTPLCFLVSLVVCPKSRSARKEVGLEKSDG